MKVIGSVTLCGAPVHHFVPPPPASDGETGCGSAPKRAGWAPGRRRHPGAAGGGLGLPAGCLPSRTADQAPAGSGGGGDGGRAR